MSSKTKIVVLHMKEVIYTGIFVVLGILLILLLIFMFLPGKGGKGNKEAAAPTSKYVAGVYSSSIKLNDNAIDVEVVVDEDHINSIELKNLSETVTTMYPLIQPSLDDLANQIIEKQSLNDITYSQSNQYTSTVLMLSLIHIFFPSICSQTKVP